jgi:hypothetical protein
MLEENLLSEEDKVNWIIANTVLNGVGHENYRITEDSNLPRYNYWEEAMLWAKSNSYFPNISDEELFQILRRYDAWKDFEKTCVEVGDKVDLKS